MKQHGQLYSKNRQPSTAEGGFTLTELLVVVAIILMLISLLIPAMQSVLDKAYQVQCISNMRQLTHGWLQYAGDNNGRLLDSNTCSPFSYCWVDAGAGTSPIKTGKLWPYCPNLNLFRCPGDPSGRSRSYSINWCLNSSEKTAALPFRQKAKALIEIPRPAETICFVEENDPNPGWNPNSWRCISTATDVNWCIPWDQHWLDSIATFHYYGANMSFADGHVEYWKWRDARTAQALPCADQPGNPDLVHLQSFVFPKANTTIPIFP